MEEIKLYIINLDIGFSHKHHLLKVINESQKEKALKYKNDKDQMFLCQCKEKSDKKAEGNDHSRVFG